MSRSKGTRPTSGQFRVKDKNEIGGVPSNYWHPKASAQHKKWSFDCKSKRESGTPKCD
jgi:hypothetical protein